MQKILYRDYIKLAPFQVDQYKRNFFETKDSQSSTGHSLAAVFAATHSGILTGNGAFYLPEEQRKGLSSWVHPYKKPIGRHHADSGGMFSGPTAFSDPIGRIQFANYVDLTPGLKRTSQKFGDRLNNPNATLDDLRKTAQYIVTKIQGKDKNYVGTGYVEIGATITDPDAIQKILDGRYLTVSISKIVDDVVCSVCGQHWKQDGMCEHRMGEIDEETGYLGFKITVGEHGVGLDYVNTPADPNGMQILVGENFETLSAIDSFDFSTTNLPHDSAPVESAYFAANPEKHELIDLRGANMTNVLDSHQGMIENLNTLLEMEDSMKVRKDAAAKQSTQGIQQPDPPVQDKTNEPEPTVEPVAEPTPDPVVEPVEPVVDATVEPTVEPVTEPAVVEPVVEDTLLDFSTVLDYIEANGSDAFYDEFTAKELDELELADAKLSAETRKNLPAGKFCGPDRSFPVNDCAHVRAAYRLLNKYKGSGSKDKIQSCVDRANSRMKCDVKSKDSLDLKPFMDMINDFLNTELTDEQQKTLVDAIYPLVDKYENLTPIKDLRQELSVSESQYAALLDENTTLTQEIDALHADGKLQDTTIVPEDQVVDAVVPGSVIDPTIGETTISDEEIQKAQAKAKSELVSDYWRIYNSRGKRLAEAYWTNKTSEPIPQN